MSLLDQLNARRSTLRHTSTVVTKEDGRRYVGDVLVGSSGYGFVVDTKPDDVPACILPHLYLGSQDCCEESVLRKYHISCVLSVGVEPVWRCSNVRYEFVPCLDLPETNICHVLREVCIPFLNYCLRNGLNVLVHCNAGVSRSPAIVVGYLVVVKNYSYTDAYNLVKSARNCISPNQGFVKALKSLG